GPVAERGVFHARDFHRVYPWGGDIRAAGLKGGGRARENLAPLEPDRVVAVAPPVHHGTRIRVDGGREVIIDLKGSQSQNGPIAVILFDEGKELPRPAHRVNEAKGRITIVPAARNQHAVSIVVGVVCQRELLEVVATAHAVGGLADLLHGRQQQANQDGD